MEILILDNLLRPIDVVDVFESMIWTERFSRVGDFELVTLSDSANQKRFVVDTLLMITESRRIMRVKTVVETIDDEKGSIITITGFEITKILDSRVALHKKAGGDIAPVWYTFAKTPGATMRFIFSQICVVGSVSPDDIIPFVDYGPNMYPADTIPEPTYPIEWAQKPASVYAALQELSDIYDLGFRLYKDLNLSKLYFNVYAGSDRTTAQTVLPPVVFSPDLENMGSTTDLSDTTNYYNMIQVVYIYKDESDVEQTLTMLITEDTINPPEGFDRRVKPLIVTSIPEEVTDIPAFLLQLGSDELMKSRPIGAFDGEIVPESYVYEQDFYLGDLVEQRGRNGSVSYMRVEEYIFVQDVEGQRSYPTLTTKKFINPGTWASWKYDIEWSAVGSEEYWGNQ